MRTISAALFALLIAYTTSLRAEETKAPRLEPVAEKMASFVKAGEAAGIVTLVTDKTGVIHVDATGKADLAADTPIKSDAIMWIASMTKPITGAAVMMLVDEGKLTIDDPVSKFIPEFADLKTPSGKPANLTIRHILTHTSGLAETPTEVYNKSTKLADMVPSWLAKPTAFEPGSQWKYCQSGINCAGRIVEVVSGTDFPTFLEKRLFAPLGMKDTTFYLTEAQMPRLAKSYKLANGKLEESPIFLLQGKPPTFRERTCMPNGGLFSTADDYAKFLRMVLNKGTVNNMRVLSEKSIEQMTTIQSGDVKTGFTPGNGWGIGWCVVKEPQGVTASLSPGSSGHGGAYGTQGWIDPKRGLAYVLMVQRANFPNSDASDVRKAFHDETVKALGK